MSHFLSTNLLFNFTVAKFASEQIAPLVNKMDAEGCIDEKVYKGLFENGVCSTNVYFQILQYIFLIYHIEKFHDVSENRYELQQ